MKFYSLCSAKCFIKKLAYLSVLAFYKLFSSKKSLVFKSLCYSLFFKKWAISYYAVTGGPYKNVKFGNNTYLVYS